ncbi:hypothetical protein VNO78_19763 [Psophocarpus tetragonolobus]|uniref:DUF4283 domain-containing protein n=1 Tax=Psophocarpus tetragonolobus TaxID=3891 RepID=A0AAN9S856_PSOTE
MERTRANLVGPLVVHVLRKQVKFKILEAKIQRCWVKNGKVKIVDMSDDFFLVQFMAEEKSFVALADKGLEGSPFKRGSESVSSSVSEMEENVEPTLALEDMHIEDAEAS